MSALARERAGERSNGYSYEKSFEPDFHPATVVVHIKVDFDLVAPSQFEIVSRAGNNS